MKNICTLFLLLFLVSNSPAHAEILKVTVKWTPASCTTACINVIEREFKKVPEIGQVNLNRAGGQAELTWKSNAPFTYQMVKRPMQMAGVAIQDLRIKVRGKIQHDRNIVKLVSAGDNTPFLLLDIVRPNVSQYIELNNPQNRLLSEANKEKLLDAESKQQIATIEGKLFEPERTPPLPYLQLITEHMSFADPKAKSSY